MAPKLNQGNYAIVRTDVVIGVGIRKKESEAKRSDSFFEGLCGKRLTRSAEFGILEKNPFYEEESSSNEEVHQALTEIQLSVLKQEILTQIDQALEKGNQEVFIKLTEQLKELEK